MGLVSVYLISFQAYSTLCGVKCYVLLDLFCTVFLAIVFDFPMIFSQNSHPDTKSKTQNVQEDNAIHFDKIYCSKGVLKFSHKYRLPQVRSIEKRRKDWFQLLLLCKPESHLQRSPVWHMILGQIRKQINIQLAVKKERLRKGLADAFTIQKIEHKDVVKLFKTQLINLKRFAKFTDVKLLIA